MEENTSANLWYLLGEGRPHKQGSFGFDCLQYGHLSGVNLSQPIKQVRETGHVRRHSSFSEDVGSP